MCSLSIIQAEKMLKLSEKWFFDLKMRYLLQYGFKNY